MENCLQKISADYISFPNDVRNNRILLGVLEPLIEKMKQVDSLFEQLYQQKFFGGSYYDGLKVGSPDEYDIDLLLNFPSSTGIELFTTDEVPGYVNLYLQNKSDYEIFCDGESFLLTRKVLDWMESVIQKAFNNFKEGSYYTVLDYTVYPFRKQGPAFTLTIVTDEDELISVDLVPCIVFNGDKWPEGFKKYSGIMDNNLDKFFVVPKPLKEREGIDSSKHWRLSFQIQERLLIRNKGSLKPALRLLKKMRDEYHDKIISSYFLKTIVLWEVESHTSDFWKKNSLSYIFMHILKRYQEHLNNKEIPYFWNDNYNLLTEVPEDYLYNTSNKILRIINNINQNVASNPWIILKYIAPYEIVQQQAAAKEQPRMCLIL